MLVAVDEATATGRVLRQVLSAIVQQLQRERDARIAHVRAIENSATFHLRDRLLRLPGVRSIRGRLARWMAR
jgi:hypothetical protein